MTGKETPKKEEAKPTPEAETKPSGKVGAKVGEGEIGGRGGLEPTRYGDWEVKGICSDF